MPNTVHSTSRPQTRMQVESWPEANRLTIVSVGDKLTTAGVAAILSTIGTYYAGLTAAQQAALTPGVRISPYYADIAVLAADAATVAASITTNIRTAGNTTPNLP
jgi:hypothetical protein